MIRIGIDAMGGDFGPKTTVQGALMALEDHKDIEIILYGNEEEICAQLPALPDRLSIVHTSEIMGEDDDYKSMARRQKPVPIILGLQDVKAGRCHGMISAGSTGGNMVSALLTLGRLEGVDRPLLLGLIHTINPQSPYMLIGDAGANADLKTRNYLEFAHIGKIYWESLFEKQDPKIGLLSNGIEAHKGNQDHKKAFESLSREAGINFVGNVEPHNLMDGTIDFLLTDGFTGNIYLKQYEEISEKVLDFLEKSLDQYAFTSKEDQEEVEALVQATRNHFDTERLSGGFLLAGVQGPVMVCHGRADAKSIAQAVSQMRQGIASDFVGRLSQEIKAKAQS